MLMSQYTGEDALVLSPDSGGVICVDAKHGNVVMDFNSEGMFRGWAALRHAASGVARQAQVGIWEEMSDVDVNAGAHANSVGANAN
jgi:hypothetical protein